MRTFGFEREYFVIKPAPITGDIVGFEETIAVAAQEGLPYDGCGYLAEARGENADDVMQAAYNLLLEEYRVTKLATEKGLILDPKSRKLDKTFKFNAMRTYGKQAQSDFSMSGKWNTPSLSHAGLHVHFGREVTHTCYTCKPKNRKEVKVAPGLLNIPAIIMRLDKEFKAEIKAAKRALGLYKIQPWGFEYRSLPATIDPVVVAQFIKDKVQEVMV